MSATAIPSDGRDPPATMAPRDAYRLWAPVYEAETAISFIDDRLVAALTPPLAGLRVLDAGCGTGRRLHEMAGAALVAGADLTWEMLAAGRAAHAGDAAVLAAADVRALPFASATFDLVWCRLVVGHLPSLAEAYAELGRVCRPGGMVIVTDFHPERAKAGQTRSFRDADGELRHVEHHIFVPRDHHAAGEAAGLHCTAVREGVVDEAVRPIYERAGYLERFQAQVGVPMVLALVFRRD